MERRHTITTSTLFSKLPVPRIESLILNALDQHKAENIVTLDLTGKSDFADRMIVASGTSQRHVASLAGRVIEALKASGYSSVPVEGEQTGDWVLIDAGDIVVHIFRPEIRSYYNLEKMWSVTVPQQLEAVL